MTTDRLTAWARLAMAAAALGVAWAEFKLALDAYREEV